MSELEYPYVRVWTAPCERCGETVTTDQHMGGPYFGVRCECGGDINDTRAVESVELVF